MEQVSTAAKGMWKFRWHGLIVSWIVAIAGVAFVFRIPDRYEASARIYVDTQSILKPLMAGLAVQPNVDQQVVMLSRTLISRPNLEKLVRMADLDLVDDSRARREATIESLMNLLRIKSTDRDNLYTLSYQDENPDRAKRVVQSLVSIFVESSLGATRKNTDSAKVFLTEQIKSYEAKLQEAESRLKEFRLRNLELQSVDGRDSASRLSELGSQLEQARLDLREAESGRDAVKAQLTGEKASSVSDAGVTQSLLQESALSIATPETDARLEAQKRGLDNLLQRFTELHPDVLSARRLIKELEAQKRQEVQELRRTAAAAASTFVMDPANSPAGQELRRMLASSEAQVASLRARVAEYSTRYAQARAQMRTSPQIEAESAQLNRDYSINKKSYEDLVARRQAAVMTGDLDVAAGVADFRLIDPPRASQQPVSPNRLRLVPIALLLALAAGLLVALIESQLRPVFYKVNDLRKKVELPVLGVVSLVVGDGEKRRERLSHIRFGLSTGGLLIAFAAILVVMSLRQL